MASGGVGKLGVNLARSARFETQLIGQPADQLIGTASTVTTRMALGQTREQPTIVNGSCRGSSSGRQANGMQRLARWIYENLLHRRLGPQPQEW